MLWETREGHLWHLRGQGAASRQMHFWKKDTEAEGVGSRAQEGKRRAEVEGRTLVGFIVTFKHPNGSAWGKI